MGRRRGAAEKELMTRPQHVCPNKACRGYALAAGDDDKGDDEQEGSAPCSAHHAWREKTKPDREKEMTLMTRDHQPGGFNSEL
jgi:hypothetical protein